MAYEYEFTWHLRGSFEMVRYVVWLDVRSMEKLFFLFSRVLCLLKFPFLWFELPKVFHRFNILV